MFETLSEAQRRLVDMGGVAYRFVISTADEDRHRTVFVPSGWILEPYNQNPLVFWVHDSDDFPIGLSNGAQLGADNKLRSTVVILPASVSELAAKVSQYIDLGLIKMASVGAIPREVAWVEDDETDRYWVEFRKIELIEWSVVPIASNRGSVMEAVRGARALELTSEQARDVVQEVLAAGMEPADRYVAPPEAPQSWSSFWDRLTS